jgi:hypothetical protein
VAAAAAVEVVAAVVRAAHRNPIDFLGDLELVESSDI